MAEPFDGCRVLNLVRSGPVADLYEAIQEPLGRQVLIKALSPSILPSSPFASVLEREAHVVASLDHPGIVRLLDFVKRGERMWLVLEHVSGWTLADVLDQLRQRAGAHRSGPPKALGAIAATGLGLQVAEALGHAHQRNVVHQKLQPEHVLINRHGAIKLAGFSMRLEGSPSDLSETLDVAGTRSSAYLAPEQILGEAADPRSDFFSLGVLLYELVAGHCPFGDGTDTNTAQRIRHDSPPLLSRVAPGVPGSLERLVARCLEKLPGDRFQSAQELIQTLRGTLKELRVVDASLAVRGGLEYAGLLPRDENAGGMFRTESPRERAIGVPLRGLVIASALLAAGGGVIQWIGSATAHPGEKTNVGPLELVPPDAASLRVVVSPWAHVFVNGQHVATTPFAEPIPLRAGTHHVRLDHPNAPSEHRSITLAPGEAILLDVAMPLELPPPETSLVPPPPEDDSP